MILSVSRRTDIPAFYSDWFMNRIREGYVMVRNPMNYHSVSKIDINSNVVDCIVFWSKNPNPIIKYLPELNKKYMYYFQYTLNAYEQDVEPNIPFIEERINTFINLSKYIGKERVIWRYDPIFISPKYTLKWHIDMFEKISNRLNGYTDTCVFSFVDMYDKISSNMNKLNALCPSRSDMLLLSIELDKIAKKFGIVLKTCSEDIKFAVTNIQPSACIDPNLISNLLHCNLKVKKDINQRSSCNCVESIDIGQYNTCKHGCKYCYANYSLSSVIKNSTNHNVNSSLLLGELEKDDKITERKVKSLIDNQLSLF